MFEVVRLEDTVHIPPSEFGKPILEAATEELNAKYPNKVIIDLGLCIALHDIIRIGESQLYQGSAHQHALVEFRLVVFRPFVGEVLSGTVVSCDQQGVRMSLGFFDDIFIPSMLMMGGEMGGSSSWSEEEQLWVWNVSEDDQLFLDLENPARFRVSSVAYRRPAASAEARAPGTQAAGSGDSEPAAMQITAAIDHPGLGLISWWPPEGDGDGDADGDGEDD